MFCPRISSTPYPVTREKEGLTEIALPSGSVTTMEEPLFSKTLSARSRRD